MNKCIFLFFFLLIFTLQAFAISNNVRAGLSLGGINWGGNIVGIDYDQLSVINLQNSSVGAELTLLNGGFIISPRVLFWQKKGFNGFYGGPSVSFGIIKDGSYSSAYQNDYSNLLFGIGGEGGWLFRFPTRIDVGGGVELKFTNNGIWMGFKVNVGYLFR